MDFFQRAPPFLIQLQNILRKYPDGGQILKELIQNADDAKASQVIFVHDEREHGREALRAKDQHVIRGQSLLVYNNEMFSDRDWEGIQRPGNSIKRKDPNTVGRFGLGFNSVYHMTDYPAIFSGKNIGILDPQENIFHRGGRLWNIEKKDHVSEDLKDQFQTFKGVLEALGLGTWEEILDSGCFEGTLFCFPLRLCPSEISDNIYCAERVEELFESFMRDAKIALLFLRHVTRISLKKIGKDGKMKTLLTVDASSKELLDTESAGMAIQTVRKVISTKYMDNRVEECEWLVTTSRDQGNLFPELIELSNKLCNLPVLDLAYPLSKQNMDLFGGRLHCILPLPDKDENQTGLPCLINGCFDLTDDRRSLKWPETDQQHDEGAKWNQILVEKVLPLVYMQAVKNGVSLVKTSKMTLDEAYGIWPDPEKTAHKARWHDVVRQIALCLVDESVLQTMDAARWITASEAVFLMVENMEIHSCLEELLLLLKVPLVQVPGHVFKILKIAKKAASNLNIVSPRHVRKLLHTDNWLRFPAKKKLLLLRYIISDGQYKELLNLKLLPLSDGSFTAFQNTGSDGLVYIDSKAIPRILLPGLAHRFTPEDLPDDLHLFLVNIGKSRTFKNLVYLTKDVVCNKLREALPQRWHSCTDKVHWHPGDVDNPPVQWIVTVWTFLQQDNDILDFFENQPIVPLTLIQEGSNDVLLGRLKRKTILLQKRDGHSIPEDITVILERAGCTIIQDQNPWLWHKNLHLFILAPTPNNILQALSNLNLNQILETFKSASKKKVKMFCDFLSQAYNFTASELDILYNLPIFCSVRTITSSDSKLVAAKGLTALDCKTIPDTLAFPNIVIKCRDELDKRLLQLMKVRLLSAVDVALLMVKAIQNGSYKNSRNEVQNVMFWILRNGYALFTQNDQLKAVCQNLCFIPCNGHLQPPSVLYDPKIDTLRVLFESDKFPPVNYHEDSILMSLRMLGLLDSIHKITPEEVLKIAQQLSQALVVPSVLKKAEALIGVCNKTVVLTKFSSHNLKVLCSLSWVPVISEASQTTLSEPMNMRSMAYCNIVEFSMPLTNSFIEKAANILGLSDLPPPEKVVENLKELGLKYKSMDQYSFYRKLHDVYKYIQDHIQEFHSDLLKGVVIWTGNGFSVPHKTVLSYPEGLDLASCVNKVPPDFLTYKYLFAKCGVKTTVPANEVIGILHKLKVCTDKASSNSGSPKKLRLVISILDWMKVNSVSGTDELPIPVHSDKKGFTLKPLSKTLYCDMEKQYLTSVSSNYADYAIVHEEISMATARYLNIPLLSTKVLKAEFFDLWGPSEPVTLRIKNILREYSEHVELFKEMIQNADDADATACHFLVDMRQNSETQKRLIDTGMESCHGPALWSYNNSKFTDADFANIIRIGAATKETQMQKIGKFGLGFNTVYHITDVPSVMSGSKVLIFDPNVNHLQKHVPRSNPGMKLDLQNNSELLNIFDDQFQPYSNVFGCKLTQPFYFDGTLIRLPFRTEKEARESEICPQAFVEEQINLFMTDFENSSETLLIFLRNVKEVSLSHLSNGLCPGLQTIKVHLQKETVQKHHVSQGVLLQREQLRVSKQLCMDILDVNCTDIVKISAKKTNTTDKFYVVQSGLGVEKSLENFLQNENLFCLPVAGVALPLKKNPSTGKWNSNLEGFKGIVFCFLPLPVSTGLPFHINGTFSVMSNRKTLWETTAKGEWNRHLLCDAVLVAIITALLQLQTLNQSGDVENYSYHTFWPDVSKVNSRFMEMVKSFYHAVAFGLQSFLPPLFSNGQECCTVTHACFLDLEMFKDETIRQLAKKVFSMHLKRPNLAIDLPDWVKHGFKASNSYSELEKNFYSCERFYREIVFENLDRLETEDRNALILYAIDLKDKELNSILVSKPCIPTTPHGNLQLIKSLVHPMGKVSALYDPEEGRFPDGAEFLEQERLGSLHTLGLLKDKLPLKELMVRAGKIKKIWKTNRNKALKQIVCVLELLNDLLKEHGPIEDKTFRDIVFLPAVPPQSGATELNDLTLMKAKDLYHYKHQALVCMTYPTLSQKHLENVKLPNNVMSFLGMDRQPSIQVVMSQLQKASEGMNLLNTDMSFYIAKECYGYLNKLLQKDPNHAGLIKEQASTFPFVYTDNEFVPVNVVAHTIPFDVSPYLYKLPKAYESFETLWGSVGICREFSYLNFFSVLEQMAINHQGTPLSQSEFKITIYLIQHCLQKISDNDLSNSIDTSQIFVPDQKCILRHVDKIFFNDTPWLSYDEELNFCNDLIPRAVVSKFGIQTRKHHTLQKLKVSSLSKWASQFGAKEEITTRIKNILKDYSSKKDILKELLQNADDAEATEVHFVLDCRTHKNTKVFGLEWDPVQGPALCVYNNKTFSSQDIEGIQHLGIGGKEDHLDKTGKFGLGFNSVFHITDCPSFVSADTIMCVFDPNLMFLETADESSPGGLFTVNTEFKQTFQDVYDTFLPATFNLQEGTIFRLPLRMANTVNRSKISDQTSSLDDLRDMCRELNEDANLILFLNHIRKITFSEISARGHFAEICSVETKIDEMDAKQISLFQQRIRDYVKNEGPSSGSSPFRISSNVEIKHSSSNETTRWLIVRQLGSEDLNDFDTLEEISTNLQQTLIPHGSIAACINRSIKGRAFYTLPLPLETGLPVHVNANFIVDAARRNICKEDGDSPKTAWKTFLLSNLIAPLYCYLLECLRESLNSRTLLHFHSFDSCKIFLDDYLSFFPINNDCVPPQWKTVVTKVYWTLFEKKLQVIPVYKKYKTKKSVKNNVVVEWSNIGKSIITEEPFFLTSELNENLELVLLNINMQLAYGELLCHAFKEAGVNVLEVNPQALCHFLREIPLLPNGGSLPAPVSNSIFKDERICKLLLEFCLKDSLSKSEVDLQGVPLLVTVDGLLHYFDKDEPKMFSYYSKLFPGASNEFLKHWENGLWEKLKKYGFVRRLDIKSSFTLVKNYLGPMYEMSPKTDARPLPLSQEAAAWLKGLWEFFRSEVIRQKTNKEQEQFDEILAIFNEWAIVPVCFKMSPSKENGKNVLPLADLKNICYPGDIMVHYLLKLGFPELDLTVLEHYFIPYVKPHMLNTENLELLLEQLSSRNDLQWKSMKATDLDQLLSWILHALPAKQNNNLLNKLKSLPLFETIEGKRQNLIAFQKIYLLDATFDLEPFQLSNLHPSTVYLKPNDLNKKLGQCMKIQLIKDLDLLLHLLLDLSTFKESQLLHILRMVLQVEGYIDFQSKEEQIITSLKPVRLIRDQRGVLREASNFYDNKVELFSVLELQEYFIPDAFWKSFDKRNEDKLHWLLQSLGMKCSLTERDFITFANQVAKSAKNKSLKSLCIKAKALYQYLLSMDLGKMSSTFAAEVGNIAFVIPLKVCDELKALHPSFTANVTTVALNGSLLWRSSHDDDSLVWTSMPLIDPSVYLSKESIKFLEGCGVLLEPTIGKVIDNIKNVCKASCGSKDLQKTRINVLKVTYGFLQNKADKFDVTVLKDVQFILVNDQKDLALPRQVVFNLHMESNFRPYLYKLPPLLACYSDLFQKVGVEAEPTIFHFANTLSTIYSETFDKTSLHANLKKTVLETTNLLFKLLSESKDTQHLSSLHLLAVDGKLYESSSLVLNNCRSLYTTTKLQGVFKFVCTTVMDDLFNRESLMKCLPEKIRPQMLSDLTRESLNFNEENLCSYGDQCPLKLKFEELFFSSMFQDGLICLLQNQTKGEITKKKATQDWNHIFGTLKIICCSRLQTVLMYEDKALGGSQCKKTVYAVKCEENGCQIYFQHSDSSQTRKRLVVIKVLAHEINNLMGYVLTHKSFEVLAEMLACDHPNEIAEVLKEHNLWNNIRNQSTTFLPNPGDTIPSEWHDCLDMSIINTFKVGDYVGYMLPCEEDECYLYAVIVQELDKKIFGNAEIEMYLINIGQEDFIEVSVLDLYQFKRCESQSMKALVLFGNPQPVGQSESRIFSAEDLKKTIDLYLSQIQELPDTERQRAIRRLYLKYHPDKNVGQEELYTEICKYLQQKVKEMYSCKGMSRHGSPSSTNHSRSSGGSSRSTGGSFNCWAKWNSQATNHKHHREHFSRTTRSNYDFWGYHSTPNRPKPQEAERWLRQALCDLKAAEHDVGHGHTEWVFYKVHQAVEKALFAAQYLKKGKKDQDHSIVSLAKTVSAYYSDLQSIPAHVKQMIACGVDKEKTQYPSPHGPPGIPNTCFDPGHEEKVIALAKLVVNQIEGYIVI